MSPMDEAIIRQICHLAFDEYPTLIQRCAEGIGNYVYMVECDGSRYGIRCSGEKGAYRETVRWLKRLGEMDIPVPQVIKRGSFQHYEYLILSWLEGRDIGLVYTQLTRDEKKTIAREIVRIQNEVAALEPEDIPPDWSWLSFVHEMLDRAEARIIQNGYFDAESCRRLRVEIEKLDEYFSAVRPVAYLDDISSKNLLIHNGRLSGIIDVDQMGFGDKLTYVALTYMALLNMEYDTDYVNYILEEMELSREQRRAFIFYALMYCVDFMGERGMSFMDKTVEVSPQIIDRLERIYDTLWEQWCEGSENAAFTP